jgi:plasmid maintenance system antidote protein VapI
MTSFQISISPNRRAAARFVAAVRRELQKAYAEESAAEGITQSEIARRLGVHRSVINRELKGMKDMTLGRVGELGWAIGRVAKFTLTKPVESAGANDSSHQYAEKTASSEEMTQVSAKAEPLTATKRGVTVECL